MIPVAIKLLLNLSKWPAQFAEKNPPKLASPASPHRVHVLTGHTVKPDQRPCGEQKECGMCSLTTCPGAPHSRAYHSRCHTVSVRSTHAVSRGYAHAWPHYSGHLCSPNSMETALGRSHRQDLPQCCRAARTMSAPGGRLHTCLPGEPIAQAPG